jgi:hypothetical protein
MSVASAGYNSVISGRDLLTPTAQPKLPKDAVHPIETTARRHFRPALDVLKKNPIKTAIL